MADYWICSWCVDREVDRERLMELYGPDITHGICDAHLRVAYPPTIGERCDEIIEAVRRTLTPLGWRVAQALGWVALALLAYVVGFT